MFQAQLLIGKSEPYTLYSPWFVRGGDSARFAIDVVEETMLSAGVAFTIDIVTKNTEDAGNGLVVTTGGAGSFTATTGAGQTQFVQDGGLKELVRFEFTVPGGVAGDWVLFRMLRPQWFDVV
jgi:hypothetical protein